MGHKKHLPQLKNKNKKKKPDKLDIKISFFEFPGGSMDPGSELSLLWHRYNPWPRNFPMPRTWPKIKLRTFKDINIFTD